jgi:hypothetical protein
MELIIHLHRGSQRYLSSLDSVGRIEILNSKKDFP